MLYYLRHMLPEFSLPVVIFLIPYTLFVLMYMIYSLFNLYHILRFGVSSFGTYLITTIFLGGTVFLAGASWYFLMPYDWTALWNISDILKADPSLEMLQKL